VGLALVLTWTVGATQAPFTSDEQKTAVITMVRDNTCGLGSINPSDLRQCPTYSVSLSGDGRVTYTGVSGVKTVGTRNHRTVTTSVRALMAECQRADLFALLDRYTEVLSHGVLISVSDRATTTLSWTIAGRTKSIYDYYGTPEIVRHLEAQVDKVSDAPRYTGRPDTAR
jgi:hypothetical protein